MTTLDELVAENERLTTRLADVQASADLRGTRLTEVTDENDELREALSQVTKERDRLQHAAEFAAKMCWRTDPPNAVNKLTDSERLSAIKHHPTIKEVGKPHKDLAEREEAARALSPDAKPGWRCRYYDQTTGEWREEQREPFISTTGYGTAPLTNKKGGGEKDG